MRSLLGVLNIFGSLLTWFALFFALPVLTALIYGELAPLRGFVAGAGVAVNDVGLEALAVAHVADEDFFVGQQADALGEVAGNRHAALVVEAGSSNRGTVDFRLK